MLLLAMGLAVSLGLGEAAVRNFGLAPELIFLQRGRYRLSTNPDLGYVPAPGSFNRNEIEGFDYPDSETNSEGFRSPEYPKAKPANTFRISVIGDSLAMGLWIAHYRDTFPARLEAGLKEFLAGRRMDVQVQNFGVTGYNTKQEVAMLESSVLSSHPDLVLLEYCLNDSYRNDALLLSQLLEQSKAHPEIAHRPPLHPFLAKSALVRFLYLRTLAVLQPAPKAASREEENRLDLLSRDTTEESLRKLGSIARELKLPVLVVIFPDFSDLKDYRFLAEHQRIAKIVEEEKMLVLDLLAPFRDCAAKSSERLSFEAYHPTEAGNACAANAMADFIERNWSAVFREGAGGGAEATPWPRIPTS